MSDNVSEVEIPSIMPRSILKASGHVDRFKDFVVYDKNMTCYRADHLAKKWFTEKNMPDLANQVDSWDRETLEKNINKFAMLDSDCKVFEKNLMIEVSSNTLNPTAEPDYLRPELAQGIFVGFKSYCDFYQTTDGEFRPFGIAQVGKSYRKEISPQSFIRMREFTQAEIEYFVDPLNKDHSEFDKYSSIGIPILTAEMQENGQTQVTHITISDAVKNEYISHKLMAYFLAKIYLFAQRIGLKNDLIRFRQHRQNEMAHYAIQCWDLECLVNGSWLECVGCADRGSYDLTAHSNSYQTLNAKRKLNTPKKQVEYMITPIISKFDKKDIGSVKNLFKSFDSETAAGFVDMLRNENHRLKNIDRSNMSPSIEIGGKKLDIDESMVEIKTRETTITHETFVPHVIEPSFGIDRLIYATIFQNLTQRPEDNRRLVLSIPPNLSLYDVAVFPLHKKPDMISCADSIRTTLQNNGYKCYTDDSGMSIGKKYVRCDEIGVRWVITVDPGTLNKNIVTIRDRDSTKQTEVPVANIVSTIHKLNTSNSI